MSVIKWIKIALDMFDDEKLKIIDAMPERDTIHYVWMRLLIQAGKTNATGNIYLNEEIPYTKEMLSIIFNRSVALIELSLKTLSSLKMIEIDKDNVINISNWDKHQNIEGMEKIREQTRQRVEKHRSKKKSKGKENEEYINQDQYEDEDKENEYQDDYNKNEEVENNNEDSKQKFKKELGDKSIKNCNVTVTDQNKKENETKKEIKNKTKNEEKEIKHKYKTESEKLLQSCNDNDSDSEVMKYIKKINGKITGGSLCAFKSAISIYGETNVELAIQKALELNKPRMNYINGILRNWKTQGLEVTSTKPLNNKYKGQSKGHKVLAFNNFDAREYDYVELEKKLLGW